MQMNILNNSWFVTIIGGIIVFLFTEYLIKSLIKPSLYSRANSKFLNMIRFRVVSCSIPTINEVANEIHKTSGKSIIRKYRISRISDGCRLVISEIKADPYFSKLERETHIRYINDFIISVEEFQIQNETDKSGLIATYIKLLKKYEKSTVLRFFMSWNFFSFIILALYVLTNNFTIKLLAWFYNPIIVGKVLISGSIRFLAVWLTMEVILWVCFLFFLRFHDRQIEKTLKNFLGENENDVSTESSSD